MYRGQGTQMGDQGECIVVTQAVVELVCHHGEDQMSIAANAFPNSSHQLTVTPTSDAGCDIGCQIGTVHIPETGAHSGEIKFTPAGLGFRGTVSALRSMAV